MDEVVDGDIVDHRRQTLLLGGFAALALLLAALGIYSVLSYSIAQRTREIGVRVALGATAGNVVGLVVREGMSPVAGGLTIGLVVTSIATRAMSAMLYGVPSWDPKTQVAAVTLLLAVALVACYIPARRASSLDPIAALRREI
jgi:putative ABC transport system permease protein